MKVIRAGMNGLGDSLEVFRERARTNGDWTYLHSLCLADTVDRNSFLAKLIADRRVIHIGCAAEGATRQQVELGKLLFAQLEKHATAQLGVDPDSVAMRELSSLVTTKWPLQVCEFQEVDPKLLDQFNPEFILLPEVIEHIADPGSLLRYVKEVALRYTAEIVVTVPNALSMSAVSAWLRGQESVHPDHVAAYTPRTLQTLFEKCGLQPVEIRPYSWGAHRRFSVQPPSSVF
jgi:methyltransferase family protein